MKNLESISSTYLVSNGDRVVVNVGTIAKPVYAIGTVRSVRSSKASILLDNGDIVSYNAPKRIFYKVGIVGIGIDRVRKSYIPEKVLPRWITVKKARNLKGLNPSYSSLVTMIKRADSVGLEGRKRSEALRDYLVTFVTSMASQVLPKTESKPIITLSGSNSLLNAEVKVTDVDNPRNRRTIFSVEASKPVSITIGTHSVRAARLVKNPSAKNKEIFSKYSKEGSKGINGKVEEYNTGKVVDDATVLKIKSVSKAVKELDKAFDYLYSEIDDSIKALTVQKPFRKMRNGEFEGSYLNEKSMWDSVRNQKAEKFSGVEPDVELILSKGRDSIVKSMIKVYTTKGEAAMLRLTESRVSNIRKYADTLSEFFNKYVGITTDSIVARYNQLNGVLSLIDWNASKYTPIALDRRGTYSTKAPATKTKGLQESKGDGHWLSNSRTGLGMIVKLKPYKELPGGEYIAVDGNIVASGKYKGMPELVFIPYSAKGPSPVSNKDKPIIRRVRRDSMHDFIKDAVNMAAYSEIVKYQAKYSVAKRAGKSLSANDGDKIDPYNTTKPKSYLPNADKVEQGDVISYRLHTGDTVTKIVSSVNERKGYITLLEESLPIRFRTRYPIENIVSIRMKGNGFVDHLNMAYERFGYSSEEVGSMLDGYNR